MENKHPELKRNLTFIRTGGKYYEAQNKHNFTEHEDKIINKSTCLEYEISSPNAQNILLSAITKPLKTEVKSEEIINKIEDTFVQSVVKEKDLPVLSNTKHKEETFTEINSTKEEHKNGTTDSQIQYVLIKPLVNISFEIKDKLMINQNSPLSITNNTIIDQNGSNIFRLDTNSKIKNGAINSKDSAKVNDTNDMMELLTTIESDYENFIVQELSLKKQLKLSQKKIVLLESEITDLKCKETEYNILLQEYKNKKSSNGNLDLEKNDDEVKRLKAKENTLNNENAELKFLLNQQEIKIKELQEKEVDIKNYLCKKSQCEFVQLLEKYDDLIVNLSAENLKLREDMDDMDAHLLTLEYAFSNLRMKYINCKELVQCYQKQKKELCYNIAMTQKHVQKCSLMEFHCNEELKKSKLELSEVRKQQQSKIKCLTYRLKCHEIKNASLMEALRLKTKECKRLAAMCDRIQNTEIIL